MASSWSVDEPAFFYNAISHGGHMKSRLTVQAGLSRFDSLATPAL